MRRVTGLAAMAVLTAVLATPAEAHWRFTRWGMTADEVIAASDGKVGPRDPEAIAREKANDERLVAAGYHPPQNTCSLMLLEPLIIAGIEFNDVQFCFSTAGRLTVVINNSASSADEVVNALAQSFGPPVNVRLGEYPAWTFVDREQGNTLTLEAFSRGGSGLAYTPIAKGF